MLRVFGTGGGLISPKIGPPTFEPSGVAKMLRVLGTGGGLISPKRLHRFERAASDVMVASGLSHWIGGGFVWMAVQG